jgi:hypothetical protein
VPGERLFLYEIGPGDVWRTPTRVSLQRAADGYRLEANAPCAVDLVASKAEKSTDDGATWSEIPAGGKAGVRSWTVSLAELAAGKMRVRWTP